MKGKQTHTPNKLSPKETRFGFPENTARLFSYLPKQAIIIWDLFLPLTKSTQYPTALGTTITTDWFTFSCFLCWSLITRITIPAHIHPHLGQRQPEHWDIFITEFRSSVTSVVVRATDLNSTLEPKATPPMLYSKYLTSLPPAPQLCKAGDTLRWEGSLWSGLQVHW